MTSIGSLGQTANPDRDYQLAAARLMRGRVPAFGGGGGTINGRGGSGNVSGGGRGNTSTGGGRGNNPRGGVDRINDKLGVQHPSWGNRPETSYGAPAKANATYGVYTALGPQQWESWKNQVDTYNEAANKWNSTSGMSIGNLANNMQPFGFHMVAPDLNHPNTYVGGDYHLGVNPVALAGSIGSLVTGIPALGTVGGKLYDLVGGRPIMLGGGDIPAGWDPSGAAKPASTSSIAPGASPTSGRITEGGTVGGVTPVLLMPVNTTAASGAGTPDGGGGADGDTAPPAAQPTVAPYPYDPLKFGETLGGWNFWPNGHPVAAADGGKISGPGDGQSDQIPALLSNNEHVIDAATVAAAGRGDSDAGHKVIENWKQSVRKKAGYKNPKKAPLMGSIGSLARAA